MKFTLPLAPTYCEHWGLWEAIREIYQNALDEGGAKMDYLEDDDYLVISSGTGRLTPETLVLGSTSKRNDPTLRGKFGEGYKLALLVLTRLGHNVLIHSGSELWQPKLEHDDAFNATVLNIYTESVPFSNGVQFRIEGVRNSDYETIQRNVRQVVDEPATILDDENEAGRIYVGGLYVTTAQGYQCGYSFPPGTIKLDRDRGMVDGFDLSYETSRLWTMHGGQRSVELLEQEAPDVRYVDSHVTSTSALALHSLGWFVGTHGHQAVPVSSQDEIQRATAAGLKWVLVSDTIKNVLRCVKSWVIPSTPGPLQRLQEFRKRFEYHLPANARIELDKIIESMEE